LATVETANTKSTRRTGKASAPIDGLTPAMRQFVEQKKRVGEAILLFRMGDFYETFYDDALLCSKVLGIALTARNKNSDNPIPLAGIPYHALETYLRKLVVAGHKVAISEQLEDPKEAKGVVKRDVVRIVTAGTLTDEALQPFASVRTRSAWHWSNWPAGDSRWSMYRATRCSTSWSALDRPSCSSTTNAIMKPSASPSSSTRFAAIQ
jgi:hypothetical protein